ncbi:MAG: hypothetical protein JW904_07545 [Spirochaetales bacterium]|nr:hypothetical protein [Spirochaetales bacterium]
MKRLLIFIVFLFLTIQLFAQDSSTAELQQRITDLEKRVQILEDTVQHLQSGSVDTPVPAGLEAWRKLKRGMTEDEVRRLLGEPDRIIASGAMTIWYFGEPAWASMVNFVDNKVNGWTEPR